MSLLAFQRALADFAASPNLCREAIADPVPVLDRYDLSPRERFRLASMVRDPLMETNCVLYRVNRVTPIYVFFPLTCHVLGPDLRGELDVFWSTCAAVDLQYLPETERFAGFLRNRARRGELKNSFVEETVEYESTITALRFAARDSDPLLRIVKFLHDPAVLLEVAARGGIIPEDIPQGEYWVLLDASGPDLTVSRLTLEAVSKLRSCHSRDPESAGSHSRVTGFTDHDVLH